MQFQPAQDQRQHQRREVSLVVSYRPEDPKAGYGIAQARNISQGGLLLTTARAFAPGALLAIRVRLPIRCSPSFVSGKAQAVESREMVQGLLYETRLRLIDINRWSTRTIGEFCTGTTDVLAACCD